MKKNEKTWLIKSDHLQIFRLTFWRRASYGGLVVIVRSTPDRAVRARALVGDANFPFVYGRCHLKRSMPFLRTVVAIWNGRCHFGRTVVAIWNGRCHFSWRSLEKWHRPFQMATTVLPKWHRPFQMATTVYEGEIGVGDIAMCSWTRHLILTIPLSRMPSCVNWYRQI